MLYFFAFQLKKEYIEQTINKKDNNIHTINLS